MITKQKILDQAFLATLVFSGFNLLVLLFLSSSFSISWIGLLEIILFPTLGYLTKIGNKKASVALLALFIFDRFIYLINWGSQLSTKPINIVVPLLISFILWSYFYKAYWIMKKQESQGDKIL
jgi:hypothetical protein